MSADSPRRSSGGTSRGMVAVPSIVPPQVVSDRSILDSAIGFINEVTLAHQPLTDPKDTITWARFETAADISDPRFGEDWELEGNVSPPLLLILGYGLGVQVWAIPANGEAVEVLSWRHGIVSALRVLPTPSSAVAIEENGRADEPTDTFAEKRPLIALVDGSSSSGSQPQFCAVNFISLKTGSQVKTIKFKNPVIDILANRSSIVITFHERIAVFDARTFEDRLSITTCYPSPGINPNPVALGQRWLAYAEHKLLHSKRSGGGCDGDGVASYTATVLNASKSLVKGLRELGEQVAAGLTGTSGSAGNSKNTSFDSGLGPDSKQSGIVTIIDVKNAFRDNSPTSGVSSNQTAGTDPIIAHFIAHSEALVAMEFDNSGMLLVTADRRGHDFHVFRIQPNPVGPSLAAVHHLYVLHRGDTSAKVQNISLSLDTRWVAVSTLRGTTHVFPITPYGGPMGVRTHTSLHVVNKLSRFHRSAGLSAEGRSNSPISHSESTTFTQSLQPYHNPTLPPFHRPTVVMPLAQLRQPFALGSPPGSATLAGVKSVSGGGSSSGSQRQRLSSLSDDSGKPLSVCAIFAKSRSWLLDPPNVTREAPHRMQRKAVDSLFVMAGHGALIQYDLDTKLASNVAKEKICDDTPIDLEVEAKAQWNLGRRKEGSQEIMPPLSLDNWLVKNRNSCMLTDSTRQYDDADDRGESWLAQVEIVTHAGPHRRLWMGPQFVFKTYNTPSGSNLSHVDVEAVEIGTSKSSTATTTSKPEQSSPLNMPLTAAGRSSAVPVLIESGSYSSIEQSPKLMDRFRHDHLDSDYSVTHGDSRLKEDLADAMRESPCVAASLKDCGRGCESGDNVAFYDALADHDDQDDQDLIHARTASAAALASALPNIHSYDNSSSFESLDSLKRPKASIEKIVNPLGTVTTVTSCLTADVKTDILDEVVSQLAAEDTIIHENCDESLFRPVVAIFCDEKTRLQNEEEARKNEEYCQPPETISNKLVVPVIAKEVDDELNKKEKQKNTASKAKLMADKEIELLARERNKFEELSSLNKKSKGATTKQEQTNENIKIVKEITKAAETTKKVKETTSLPDKTAIAQDCGKRTEECKLAETVAEKVEKECVKKPVERSISPNDLKNSETSKKPSNSRKIEEEPLEFIRMTPKVTPQKVLSKKEIKKQQQQKAKDESTKQVSSCESSKKIEVKRAKIEDDIKTEEKLSIVADEKITETRQSVNENIKPETKKENDIKIKTDNKSAAMSATNKELVKSIPMEEENYDVNFTASDKNQIIPTSSQDKTETQTAFNVTLSAVDKTAIKEEIKTTPQNVKVGSRKTERKGLVKTEQLNVKGLTDSLIELRDEEQPLECMEKIEIENENCTFEIVDDSKKSLKKTKKKGNKSGSSSENEEVVEVRKESSSTALPKSEERPHLAKKTSKSEDIWTESRTESKDSLEKIMFDSLTQLDECKTSKVDEKSKLNVTKTTDSSVVVVKSSEKSSKVENVEMKQERNVNKSKTIEKLESTKEASSCESSKKIEVKQTKMEDDIKSDIAKIDKIGQVKENIREVKKSEEKLLSDKKKLSETENELDKEKDPNKTSKKKEDLTKPQEEIPVNKPAEESQIKTADKEKTVEMKKTVILSEKVNKVNLTKADDDSKANENKSKITSAVKSEHPVLKEPLKDDNKSIISDTQKGIKEKPNTISNEKTTSPKSKTDSKSLKEKQHEQQKQEEIKSSETENTITPMERNKKTEFNAPINETNKLKVTPPAASPKKKIKDVVHDETKKTESDAKSNKKEPKKLPETIDDTKKWQTVVPSPKEDQKKMELTPTTSNTKEVIAKEKPKAVGSFKGGDLLKDTTDSCEKKVELELSKKLTDKIQTPTVSSGTCAWKTLSGAEMINKSLNKSDTDNPMFPSMGAIKKSTVSKTSSTTEKLLPELITPKEGIDSISLAKISKKTKKAPALDDFSSLKPLESLPPLPVLEPLELLSDTKSSNLKDFSLINFESPLQENPALQRKITPPPRGFTEQNLIFALCGSLHYENEHVVVRSSPDKVELSPTLSSNRSSSALDEPSMADYKSLTENEDPYVSLEQSSQDTNTTNEKFSSSTNSSGSEEIIIMEEKKMTKKQKRKRQQQQLIELQKQKDQQQEVDDEELRPLIAMTESQIEQIPDNTTDTTLPTLMDASYSIKPLTHSTTTDSEGPMPATTSEDNIFTIPAPIAHSQQKIKTKKIEHKINLIAAIEAATSSSTSSAEESGVELGGRSSYDNDESLIAPANSVAATTLPLPIVLAPQTTVGALKKKTKRRKR